MIRNDGLVFCFEQAARPASGVDECLRVLRPHGGTSVPSNSSDYLVPLSNDVTSDGRHQERCGYWETSFTREGVKAIARGQPLEAPEPQGTPAGILRTDLRSDQRSGGYSSVPTFDPPPPGDLSLSQSQSTQPLLGNGPTPPESPSAAGDADALTLDASMLCRQSYANVRIASATPTPTKGERVGRKKNEISC